MLVPRYEAIPFADRHAPVRHLLARPPGRVLDIGAGSGADAAWFAAHGHKVVAVEPTTVLREAAMARHPSPAITWLDDSLPMLAVMPSSGERFDLLMLNAVWMHLDAPERELAMTQVASLLERHGLLLLSLRHGPAPAGRRVFDVSADETVALARRHGLQPVLRRHTGSVQAVNRQAGVSWSRLAFVHADAVALRPAVPADAPRVAEILIATRAAFMPYAPSVHPDDELRAWVADRLLPSGGVTVAVDAGQVVGVIATEPGAEAAWITQLSVDPTRVGRGIGTVLLAHALASLGDAIRLYTFQANTGARRFYERQGFRVIAMTDGAGNEERCPDVLLEWRAPAL